MSRRALKRVTLGAAALAALTAVPAYANLTVDLVPEGTATHVGNTWNIDWHKGTTTSLTIDVYANIVSPGAAGGHTQDDAIAMLSGQLSLANGTMPAGTLAAAGATIIGGSTVGVGVVDAGTGVYMNNTGSLAPAFSGTTMGTTTTTGTPVVIRAGRMAYASTTPAQNGNYKPVLGTSVLVGKITYHITDSGTVGGEQSVISYNKIVNTDPNLRNTSVWSESVDATHWLDTNAATASTVGTTADGTALVVGSTVTVNLVAGVPAGSGSWVNTSGDAKWSTNGNWATGQPSAAGQIATFGTGFAAAGAVHVDAAQVIGGMTFDNATGYIIGVNGGNTVTLNGGGGNASLTLTNGSHEIAAPVTIASNLDVGGAGTGTLTLSGALNNPAGTTITKTGPGTLTISGVQTHGVGASLVVGAQTPTVVPGGTVNINTNPGAQGDGLGGAASANLAINVQEGTVNLNACSAGGGTFPDIHTVKSLTTSEDGSIKNARIMLGAGDPLGFGAGGTVIAQAYTRGTGGGAQPTRADIEAAWFQVQTGYYYASSGYGGIGTNAIRNTQKNALALQVYNDAEGWGGAGAKFIAVTSDIIGDVNGDFSVDLTDLGGLLQNLGKTPGVDPGVESYTTFTWMDGDINGDGAVDLTDLGGLLGNLGQSYDPTIPPAAMSSAAVPEPASIAMLGLGVLGLCARRRRTSR